jgi:hypothetical protein
VILANKGFVTDAHSAASGKGLPGLRVIGESIACESTVAEDIESGVQAVMNDIIAALTKPLTPEEKSPQPQTGKQPSIAFKGTYPEVNEFFYRKGWTDGLPIVPPTEEAVAAMMKGTDLAPDTVITKIIPRMGKATVKKIAVNAVMAGALPTYMPVLIAAVQALSDPKTRFDTFEVSTGSWAPFFIINGPIRNDVNVNGSSGALSPGNIANAAIGRAVGMIVKNIGGARKAVEDMGTMGNPGKYSMVLGEREEDSPWEPLHVTRGYNKEDNTVTVFFPNGYSLSIPSQTSAQGIADALAGMEMRSLSALLVIPDHANILSKDGWTKKKLKEYISSKNSAPAPKGGRRGGTLAENDFIVVVAGGPGTWMGSVRSAGGFQNDFVTKKIELPRNWKELVAKYKSLVPVYEKY